MKMFWVVLIICVFAAVAQAQTDKSLLQVAVPLDGTVGTVSEVIPENSPCRFIVNPCTYPAYYNPSSCSCACPWWGFLTCQANQYWDPITCWCPCKEPCKDCTIPQKWSNKYCDCRCPNKVAPTYPCAANRFWDEWSCSCRCKQKPRNCCSPKLGTNWNDKTCDCACKFIASCAPGYYWDSSVCNCLKTMPPWVIIDYANLQAMEVPEEEVPVPETEAPPGTEDSRLPPIVTTTTAPPTVFTPPKLTFPTTESTSERTTVITTESTSTTEDPKISYLRTLETQVADLQSLLDAIAVSSADPACLNNVNEAVSGMLDLANDLISRSSSLTVADYQANINNIAQAIAENNAALLACSPATTTGAPPAVMVAETTPKLLSVGTGSGGSVPTGKNNTN